MSKNKKNSQNNAKNRSGSSARNSSQNCPGSSSKSGSQNCRNQSDEESDEDGQGHLSRHKSSEARGKEQSADSEYLWRRQDGQVCRINKGAKNYVPSGIRWRW